MIWAFFLLLFVAPVVSATSIVSDPTVNDPVPTHCAWYFDDSIVAERTAVGIDLDGLPFCLYPADNIAPGTHTVKAAFQVDQGVWGILEGPQSLPLEFTRPVAAEIQAVPVLRLEADANVQVIDQQ